jgi:hypothetical protein
LLARPWTTTDDEGGIAVSHPEDFCQRCGARNPVWNVDSDRYNTGDGRWIDA